MKFTEFRPDYATEYAKLHGLDPQADSETNSKFRYRVVEELLKKGKRIEATEVAIDSRNRTYRDQCLSVIVGSYSFGKLAGENPDLRTVDDFTAELLSNSQDAYDYNREIQRSVMSEYLKMPDWLPEWLKKLLAGWPVELT